MKRIGAAIAAMMAAGCSVVGDRSGVDEPDFEVAARIGDAVEIRRYGPRVFVETRRMLGESSREGSAFRSLFRYIDGGNAAEAEIAMTAPVETRGEKIAMTAPVETRASGDDYVMRFFLPTRFTLETAPAPTEDGLILGQTPERVEAVIRFTGSRDAAAQQTHEALLRDALAGSGWRPIGLARAYLYDPPFTLPMFRRNEIAMPVAPAE